MDTTELQKRLLGHYGIWIESQMSGYVLKRLNENTPAASSCGIPIIGGNARTGVPVRQIVEARLLAESPNTPAAG